MWWQVAAALIGVGLMGAPDLLGLDGAAANLVNIVAPIGVSAAVIAASEVTRGVRHVATLAGAAIAVGAAVLGTPLPVLLIVVAGGIGMAATSLGGGRTTGHYGGGWRSLLLE
ncbi:MAG: hypothetical protein ACT4OQ_07960 [Chloroflexota bacterium]